MRSATAWVITIAAGAILGAAAALGAFAIINRQAVGHSPGNPFFLGPGGMMGSGGMMSPGAGNPGSQGTRISIAKATEQAKAFTASLGSDLQVTEIMEFSDNFYAVVKESSTGRGAMELLVDPLSGSVSPEPGPNMMWNSKYSPMGAMGRMMGGATQGDNTLSLDQAAQDGQAYLDAHSPGARLETDGIAFYGHYTFDYKVDNKIAGMLSVNGTSGEIWLHTWHGTFIQETEVK